MKKRGLIIFVAILIAVMCMTLAACNGGGEKGKYIVTFEANGGAQVSAITADKGTGINLPTSTREGYIFDGWYDNAELSGNSLASPYTPVANATLYAKWGPGHNEPDYIGAYVNDVSDRRGNHMSTVLILKSGGKCIMVVRDGYPEDCGSLDGAYTVSGIEITATLKNFGLITATVGDGNIKITQAEEDFLVGMTLEKAENAANYIDTYTDSQQIDDILGQMTLILGNDEQCTVTTVESGELEVSKFQGRYYIAGDDIFLVATKFWEEKELDEREDRVELHIAKIQDGVILFPVRYMDAYWMLTPSPTNGTACNGGEHKFSNWIKVTIFDCVEGTEKRYCAVCGERESQTVPVAAEPSHLFYLLSQGTKTDTHHQLECRICEIIVQEEHTLSEWTVEKNPTCAISGANCASCNRCEHKISKIIPPTDEHNYITKQNEDKQWEECSYCGKKKESVANMDGECFVGSVLRSEDDFDGYILTLKDDGTFLFSVTYNRTEKQAGTYTSDGKSFTCGAAELVFNDGTKVSPIGGTFQDNMLALNISKTNADGTVNFTVTMTKAETNLAVYAGIYVDTFEIYGDTIEWQLFIRGNGYFSMYNIANYQTKPDHINHGVYYISGTTLYLLLDGIDNWAHGKVSIPLVWRIKILYRLNPVTR